MIAGQRGAQVVADGGEQGGAQPVDLGQFPGAGRPRRPGAGLPGAGGGCGQLREDAPVLGEQLRTPSGEPQPAGRRAAVSDRFADRVGPDRRDGVLGAVAALDEGDGGHAEGVPDLVQQPGQRVLADRGGGGPGQQRGLEPRRAAVARCRAAMSTATATVRGDRDVDDQDDDVVAVRRR